MHGGTCTGAHLVGNRHGWKHGRRSRAAVEKRKARVARVRQSRHDLAVAMLALRAEDGEQLGERQIAVVEEFLERLWRG